MTFEEMKMKYREARENARESYRNEKIEWLKENGLYNGVIRNRDQKVGWLDVDFDGEIRFYPQKKDGTRSLYSSGYVADIEGVVKYQYRAKEGE